jgi:hypothetical protein
MQRTISIVLSGGLLAFILLTVSQANAAGMLRVYSTAYAGQALYGLRNVRPGMPSTATILYNGARGYSIAGWEAGRMMAIRQYRMDPGPWPGWRGALLGR